MTIKYLKLEFLFSCFTLIWFELSQFYFDLGHIALKLKPVNSIECQTDFHVDPFVVTRNGCSPSMAETESLSFCYFMDEGDRMTRLNAMINDTYDAYLASLYKPDPCTEFEHYLRGNGTGNPPKPLPAPTQHKQYETIGYLSFFFLFQIKEH